MATQISDKQLINRFTELANRSDQRGIWTETDFLSMAEQDLLQRQKYPIPYTLIGGYDSAERRIAVFGSEEVAGYTYHSPIVCISIQPAMQKFSEPLTHRNILGSLMSLGFDRKVTGDILIIDNIGYLFCLQEMAAYIMDHLISVGKTSVRCQFCDPPARIADPPEESTVNVPSLRLDAFLSVIYKLGRTAAKDLILQEKVYISGKLAVNPSVSIPENAIVSVRGYGRFSFHGTLRETRKGRLCVLVRIY